MKIKKESAVSLFLILFFISLSCSNKHKALEDALIFAGDNRPELEKVLAHYSSEAKDSLKYKAAVFLIENMPGYFTLQSPAIDSVKRYMARGLEQKLPLQQIRDSALFILAHASIRPDKIYDAHVICSEYLIDNIEWAFKVRDEQPWGQYISFDDFCEYILPYRIDTEPLDNWRETYYT